MDKKYFNQVHRWGKIWSLSALAMLMCVPVGICVYYNVWPAATEVFKALLKVIPLYWATAIIEVVTYTPMLGAGGTYLSFVTGNISNLKLPCGLSAMDKAGVRANSDEGEVISTIAIGVSSITTTIILAVGVLAFSPFLDKITAPGSAFAPAFTQILPALFGALGASYFAKHWKISIFPILAGVITLIVVPTMPAGTLLFVTIVASLLGAQVMYKLKLV